MQKSKQCNEYECKEYFLDDCISAEIPKSVKFIALDSDDVCREKNEEHLLVECAEPGERQQHNRKLINQVKTPNGLRMMNEKLFN